MLFEMIEIVVIKLERLIRRDRPGGQRLRVRFIAAERQPTDLLFEIGAPVRVAQGRRIGGQAGDRLGDHILMPDRMQRHVDPRHRADLPRPLAGTVDHGVAGYHALIGLHGGDPVAIHRKPGDADVFGNFRAMHPRSLGKALGNVGRAGLPIGGQPAGPDQIGHVHQRPHRLDLGGRNQLHLHPETARCCCQPGIFGPAIRIGRQPQAAGHFPAGFKAGLGGESPVEVHRILQHLGDRRRRPKLPDQPRRVPRRARGQRAHFKQDHAPDDRRSNSR